MENNSWILNPKKFLSKQETDQLLETSKKRAEQASLKGQKVAIRDYFIIHLALSTGLRVMEIAALNCGDLFLGNPISSLLVQKGKGGKRRLVLFNGSFKKHCQEYLNWKCSIGECTEPDQPLFLSSNTHTYMTTRAIEKVFKRCAQRAGISSFYSIHCLRHTYACFLLKASNWNAYLVKKQLGHARLITTQTYLDVMMPDVKRALDRLYK